MDIGPGDIVECVGPLRAEAGFVVGSLYTVEAANDGTCSCGKRGGLTLVGMPPSDTILGGWCVFKFRPISRKSDFAKTLADIHAKAHDKTPEPA